MRWHVFKTVRVHIDYHVEIEAHRYSVPQALVGQTLEARITRLLQTYKHPEHGYRSCLGLLSLSRRYGEARLEAACERALALGTWRYRHVRDLLANQRDLATEAPASAQYAFRRWLVQLAKTDVLVLDDWGTGPMDAVTRGDLLEIIDDRVGHRATLITHQLPIEHWHAGLADPTIADAILDRLMQRCRRQATPCRSGDLMTP